jgi:hypothetical protein
MHCGGRLPELLGTRREHRWVHVRVGSHQSSWPGRRPHHRRGHAG